MHIFGKSTNNLLELIGEALAGKICMYATPKGNVVIINSEEYERLKKLDK